MTNKRKFRLSAKKHTIVIGSLVLMSVVGVSYAYWTGNLAIHNTVTTGNLDVAFEEDPIMETIQGEGDLEVTFEDQYTMVVQGAVYSDYKGFLHYDIKNEGSIPVKFAKPDEELEKEELLQLYQDAGILKPEANFVAEGRNPKLQVQAGDSGTYNFELALPFRQWNKVEDMFLFGPFSGWEQELIIKGSIEVLESGESGVETQILTNNNL